MMDPRTKLLLTLACGALTALTRKQGWLLGEWTVLVIVIMFLGQLKAYLRWLVMLIPMALFFGGITCQDQEGSRNLTDHAYSQVATYGFGQRADWRGIPQSGKPGTQHLVIEHLGSQYLTKKHT